MGGMIVESKKESSFRGNLKVPVLFSRVKIHQKANNPNKVNQKSVFYLFSFWFHAQNLGIYRASRSECISNILLELHKKN